MTEAPLLDVCDLQVEYALRSSGGLRRTHETLRAVNGVSFSIQPGETLGLVGESGCGKSTTARAVLGLTPACAGEIRFDGVDLRTLDAAGMRAKRKDLQVVFQDPSASFNPRMSIRDIVAEPLVVHDVGTRRSRTAEALDLLDRVGLGAHVGSRRPSELSGGQRQRVGIARALAAEPRLIVCDEPVSALDVTTQAQVTALLAELQRELGLALVFIAHDLAVVRQVSDRVAVMRGGRIVEQGTVEEVYGAPADPYTKQLLAAVPALDPALAAVRRAARKGIAEEVAAA
jgi:peptide/nickel transport system ATP-binding protein